MEFTSLNEMYGNYIQSFPELTHLDLTANQIKLIELVLSYTRNGNNFYMNHTAIADYLVIGKTTNRAKTAGNIIGQLKKKGYISTTLKHNYNGKNGGSSLTVKVDETFLEQMLQAVFNTESPAAGITPDTTPEHTLNIEPMVNPNQDFLNELGAMEDELRPVSELTYSSCDEDSENEDDLGDEDFGYMEIETLMGFNFLLKELLRKDYMKNKKAPLLYLLENKAEYDLDKLKEAFEALILKSVRT